MTFKWQKYAKYIHNVMFLNLVSYYILFMCFVNHKYINKNSDQMSRNLLIAIFVSNSIFMLYDMRQFYRQGWEYVSELWNWTDQLLVWLGYLNIYIQVNDIDTHN